MSLTQANHACPQLKHAMHVYLQVMHVYLQVKHVIHVYVPQVKRVLRFEVDYGY